MSIVIADPDMCERLAVLLASVAIPATVEELRVDDLSRTQQGNFHLLSVAICHQTQTLRGIIGGGELRGWDYLVQKLLSQVRAGHLSLSPRKWESLTDEDLQCLCEDSVYGRTLSDVPGRVELVHDLSRKMSQRGWDAADGLFDEAAGRIGSPAGLLTQFRTFRAYDDPVCKKAYFLLGLMRNGGLWEYTDPENLGPPVDYHEVRGHLRLGTIRILDSTLERRLLDRERVSESEDVAIRRAVHDAIVVMSKSPGLPDAMTLHYTFWNLFRNVCTRDDPWCTPHQDPPGIPDRYAHLLAMTPAGPCCPFAPICKSAQVADRFVEHRFSTDWY